MPEVWNHRGWTMVVGLEVHAELSTATKLFCGCPNRFGDPPNTNVCPVCLGLPGSLPVLNRGAVERAIRLGIALHCEIRPSVFARKNYFYPDMPKNYQISQYEEPICADGWLELADGTRVGIERAHLEEDTGKTTHVGGGGRIHDAAWSLVDYNRAGVPLVEIVSRPDIRSPGQARDYVGELRAILVAAGVSDARMEEGSLRVDANVSVRRGESSPLGTRCEIKNLNSLRSLVRAIDHEARRQVAILEAGGTVDQETRHWDEDAGRTHTLRSKEEAEDYRYFPEPDLVPLAPDDAWVEEIRRSMPALPAERRRRLAAAAGTEPAAVALIVERGHDTAALAAIEAGADPRRLLTHLEHNLAEADPGALDPRHLARLVALEVEGALTATQAKQVAVEMVARGEDPDTVVDRLGITAVEAADVAAIVDRLIAEHPDEWARYTAGENKLMGFFIGKVMEATDRNADGKVVARLLNERRNG